MNIKPSSVVRALSRFASFAHRFGTHMSGLRVALNQMEGQC
ncbi:hypothetical protein M3J09_003216 [Ascochyta lentis]